jgi:hypothetical protein
MKRIKAWFRSLFIINHIRIDRREGPITKEDLEPLAEAIRDLRKATESLHDGTWWRVR